MNREIKFRGKRVDNSEWVYGYLTHTNKKMNPCILVGVVEVYEVDPETIGQFAGLKDKNVKEIYEGDILKDSISGVLWVVKLGFNKKAGYIGWYVEHEEIGRTSTLTGDYGADQNSYVEVIGNIYENPELLNKEQNEKVKS
jgi:uncharacterized phage protein (TIGR01671 family)